MPHLYLRFWFENPTSNVKMHLWMLGVFPFILTHFRLTLKMHLSQAMPSHQSWLTTPCFTQPWLQAQGWCYDNIPHLKWGQCPNWHYKIMFEALMFRLSLQLYFWLDFTFPFVWSQHQGNDCNIRSREWFLHIPFLSLKIIPHLRRGKIQTYISWTQVKRFTSQLR
jgi:hypothetical protein